MPQTIRIVLKKREKKNPLRPMPMNIIPANPRTNGVRIVLTSIYRIVLREIKPFNAAHSKSHDIQ